MRVTLIKASATVLAFLLIVMALGASQITQQRTFPPSAPARYDAAFSIDGPFTVIQMEAIFEPGETVPVHSHSGPELFAVLEGELTLRLDDEGTETVYTTGQASSVPGGVFFQLRNDSDAPTRFLATLMIPEGQPVMTPRP
jgi:quercetin dioxygenase-like cupin family protein